MLRRLAARLLTGPLAFLVAGAADLAAAWGGWAAAELRSRISRARRRGGVY